MTIISPLDFQDRIMITAGKRTSLYLHTLPTPWNIGTSKTRTKGTRIFLVHYIKYYILVPWICNSYPLPPLPLLLSFPCESLKYSLGNEWWLLIPLSGCLKLLFLLLFSPAVCACLKRYWFPCPWSPPKAILLEVAMQV